MSEMQAQDRFVQPLRTLRGARGARGAPGSGVLGNVVRLRIVGCLLASVWLGCASLAVSPDDPTGVKVGKIVTRIPLTVLTLSLSEFQIQKLESGIQFESYVEAKRSEIAAARAKAAAAEEYAEFREWNDYADELEAELDGRIQLYERSRGSEGQRIRARGAGLRSAEVGDDPDEAEPGAGGGLARRERAAGNTSVSAEPVRAGSVSTGGRDSAAPSRCHSRTEGQSIVTECE